MTIRKQTPDTRARFLDCAAFVGLAASLALAVGASAATPSPGSLNSAEKPGAAQPDRPAVPSAPEHGLTAGERPATGNPLWTVPLRMLSVTRERPIFSPSRRPPLPPAVATPRMPPPPSAPAKPAEPDRPLLSLVGTVTGASEGIGVFLEDSTKNVLRLRLGENYAGWVLRAVERRDARFEKNDRMATLSFPPPGALQTSSPIAAPPTPAAVPPTPAGIPPTPVAATPTTIATPPTTVPVAAGIPPAAATNAWTDSNGNPIPPSRSRYRGGRGATP